MYEEKFYLILFLSQRAVCKFENTSSLQIVWAPLIQIQIIQFFPNF